MSQQEINAGQIKDLLGEDLGAIIKKLTDSKKTVTLKDFHSGRVEDNDDPEQLGRCKIRVYGVHSDKIPTKDLPWVAPDFDFIGSALGSFIVPPVDVIVNVYFDKGDIYNPRYTTKVLDGNLPSGIDEDYPDTMVFFETDQGEYFKVNRRTGKTTYRHSSGVIFTITQEGDISLDTDPAESGSIDINIKGAATVMADTLTIGKPGFSSVVTPVAPTEGGPFCALPQCLFTGTPHQGKLVTNCNILGGLEAN